MLIYKHIVSILEPVIRISLSISEPQVKNRLAYKKKEKKKPSEEFGI